MIAAILTVALALVVCALMLANTFRSARRYRERMWGKPWKGSR